MKLDRCAVPELTLSTIRISILRLKLTHTQTFTTLVTLSTIRISILRLKPLDRGNNSLRIIEAINDKNLNSEIETIYSAVPLGGNHSLSTIRISILRLKLETIWTPARVHDSINDKNLNSEIETLIKNGGNGTALRSYQR